MTDVFALALLGVVAILAAFVWLTHRDVSRLHSGFNALIAEMRTDRVVMTQALIAMQGAVQACNRVADAVIELVRKQGPKADLAE
jgi:hypothetical protein